MEKPYCIVDEKEYQLVISEHSGTIRFPDTFKGEVDLNQMHLDYCRGRIELDKIWEYYTQSGSSFSMVEGLFSMYGTNSHTVTNGNGRFKTFKLYSGDEECDSYFNEDNVSAIHMLNILDENKKYFTKKEKIILIRKAIVKLNNEVVELIKN